MTVTLMMMMIGTTSLAEAAVAVPVPIVGLTLLPAVALHRLRQVPVGVSSSPPEGRCRRPDVGPEISLHWCHAQRHHPDR